MATAEVAEHKVPPAKVAVATEVDAAQNEVVRVFFDFEGTGLGWDARIVEIGAVSGREEFVSRVKPLMPDPACPSKLVQAPMHPESVKITGITDEMLQSAPLLEKVWPQFFAWLDKVRAGRPVALVAHNGFSYDYRVLVRELDRWLVSVPDVAPVGSTPYDVLAQHGCRYAADSMVWVRRTLSRVSLLTNEQGRPAKSLSMLYRTAFNATFKAHGAVEDCRALQRLCLEYAPMATWNSSEPGPAQHDSVRLFKDACQQINTSFASYTAAQERKKRAAAETATAVTDVVSAWPKRRKIITHNSVASATSAAVAPDAAVVNAPTTAADATEQ